MESVLRILQHAGCETQKAKEDGHEIVEEIQDVCRQLAYNECWFQMECDENLIEACIYQREELRARYRYLLNLAKRMGVSSTTFQF